MLVELEQALAALVGLVPPVPVVPAELRQAVREVLGRVIPVAAAVAVAPPILPVPVAQVRILAPYSVLAVAVAGQAVKSRQVQ
jgi:hypothetical protein